MLGVVFTIHTEYLTYFHWKVVRMINYTVHTALPTKRDTRRCIYYPHRIPYSFLLEGSLEDELSCPHSTSVQMLRLAGYLLSTHSTLLLLLKGYTDDELFCPYRHLLKGQIIYSPRSLGSFYSPQFNNNEINSIYKMTQ